MGKNKFPLFILVVIACFIAIGCSRRESSANAYINVDAEPEAPQSSTNDKTAELKEISFQNFEGKTMEDVLATEADSYMIDFDEFFNLAGLEHDIVGDDIVVMPINYNRESDFCVQIHFDQDYRMVHGTTISRGRNADTSWRKVDEFESATDWIFDATLDGEKYLIGADAMDYLWRQIRLLTAPAEKADAVNQAVDAELASYSEIPDEFN